MAVVLGYGGLANTNGARDFSGKVESEDKGTSTIGHHSYKATGDKRIVSRGLRFMMAIIGFAGLREAKVNG